jgi:hypothetical protein
MKKLKITINGVEIPDDQIMVSEAIFDNKSTGMISVAVRTPEVDTESADRLEHQLEALRWLQGKTSNEFVSGWMAMHIESLERAGGTPERS